MPRRDRLTPTTSRRACSEASFWSAATIRSRSFLFPYRRLSGSSSSGRTAICQTRTARTLVSERKYGIQDAVANLGQLGAFVTALFQEDLKLLGRAISDRLAEPVRTALIPGFAAVKAAALGAGALGCSISGAGPSVFAFCDADDRAAEVAAAMQASFAASADLESDAYVGPVNETGAVVIG